MRSGVPERLLWKPITRSLVATCYCVCREELNCYARIYVSLLELSKQSDVNHQNTMKTFLLEWDILTCPTFSISDEHLPILNHKSFTSSNEIIFGLIPKRVQVGIKTHPALVTALDKKKNIFRFI